jgi:hypothetical protein
MGFMVAIKAVPASVQESHIGPMGGRCGNTNKSFFGTKDNN